MNATGVHYPDEVLRGLLSDRNKRSLTVTPDRQLRRTAWEVGVLLLELPPHAVALKFSRPSCRVVSFGAGAVILKWLIEPGGPKGCSHLAADFVRPTVPHAGLDIAYRFAGCPGNPCPLHRRSWARRPIRHGVSTGI